MLFSRQEISVRIASALLVLRLTSKRLAVPISMGFFLYISSLPISAELAKLMRWVALLLLGCWFNAPPFEDLFQGRSPRSAQIMLDRRITWAIYVGLLWGMPTHNAFLRSFCSIQWISRLGSSNTFLLLYGLFVAASFSKTARAFWTSTFFFFEYISVIFRLFLRSKFFRAQNWFRRNQNLVKELVWGLGFFPAFDFRYFFVFLVGLLIHKRWGKVREHLYQHERPINNGTSTHPKYKYAPLPTGHVRLLLLHSRHPTGPVECSLIPVLLAHAPHFEAMSYMWGSEEKEFNVLVDGKEVPVTANAYKLLRDMSSYLFPRLIWIDSICIDQDVRSEKGEQVSLMGEIYSRASLVTVWLSTSAPNQSDDDEYIENIQAALALHYIKQWSSMEADSSKASWFLRSLTSEKLNPIWDVTLKLVDNPYFERTWIIQEIVLATRVRVLYRTVEIDWETLFGGVECLGSTGITLSSASDIDGKSIRSTSPAIKLSQIKQIQIWRTKRQQGELISFRDAAFYARRFKATNLQDKIFAILGLCSNVSGESTVPDYSMGVADVFLNATRRLIKEEGIPRLFFAAGIGYLADTTPGLEISPSWAPDWSRAFYCVPFSYLRPYLDYSAGGDAQSEANRLDGTSLFLSGHLLDTIAELAPPFDYVNTLQGGKWDPQQDFHKGDWNTILESFQLILESSYVQTPYQYTDPPQIAQEVFWRLLIGDRTWTQQPPAPADMCVQFLVYLKIIRIMTVAQGTADNEGDPRSWEELLGLYEACQQYRQYVACTCAQRRVCVTEKGYVGLVPAFSRIGDRVAVVLSAQAPLVVRRIEGASQETKYQLVGECYVHGIMYGEALTANNSREIIEVV